MSCIDNKFVEKKTKLEIQLLLDQRESLISDIKELNNNMFKVIIVIIPLIATIAISYLSLADKTYANIIRYIALEIILILSMVVVACLFAANVNRDYIAAIDKYIFDIYDIPVLFYGGELSMEHTTGLKGAFPLITGLIGSTATYLILLFLVYIFIHDINFYISHVYLPIMTSVQIIAYIYIICNNFKRKISKKSNITNECYNYIKRKKQ